MLEDVILDVLEAAAGGCVVGVDEGAAAERRLELGAAADQLRPHPLHLLLRLGAALRPATEEAHQLRRRRPPRRQRRVCRGLAAVGRDHRLEGRHAASSMGDDGGRVVACRCCLLLMREILHGSRACLIVHGMGDGTRPSWHCFLLPKYTASQRQFQVSFLGNRICDE